MTAACHDGIVALARPNVVVLPFNGQDVVALAAIDIQVVAVGQNQIVAVAAVQFTSVGADLRGDDVVASLGEHTVIGTRQFKQVVARVAHQGGIIAHQKQGIVTGQAVKVARQIAVGKVAGPQHDDLIIARCALQIFFFGQRRGGIIVAGNQIVINRRRVSIKGILAAGRYGVFAACVCCNCVVGIFGQGNGDIVAVCFFADDVAFFVTFTGGVAVVTGFNVFFNGNCFIGFCVISAIVFCRRFDLVAVITKKQKAQEHCGQDRVQRNHNFTHFFACRTIRHAPGAAKPAGAWGMGRWFSAEISGC